MFNFLKRSNWGSSKTTTGSSNIFYNAGNAQVPQLSDEQLLEVSAVNCAVQLISETVASTPLRLMNVKESKSGTVKEVNHDHWAAKLISSPNSVHTPMDFWQTMISQMILGRGALAIKTIVNGECRELIPISQNAWQMSISGEYGYSFDVRFDNGATKTFEQHEVLFIKGLSTDGFTGIDLSRMARNAVGISRNLETQQINVLQNGGLPSGVIESPTAISKPKKENIENVWNNRFASGQSGMVILDEGTTFRPVSLNSRDSQTIENRRFQIEEIARYFRLPSCYMGLEPITSDARKEFVIGCLRPFFVRTEQVLAKQILGNNPKLAFDWDELDLLRGDHTAQGQYFQAALGNGGAPAWLSVNEIRHEVGKSPIDEDYARKPLRGGYEGANGTTGKDPK